jgi:DNA-directed RNA polymerase specialized sigma24 family protein
MNDLVDRLRFLMSEHALTRARVAELLGVQKNTVDSWLAPASASCSRSIPAHRVELLEYKLRRRSRRGGA